MSSAKSRLGNKQTNNKQTIIQDISDNIAEAAIGVRWNAHLGNTTTVKTLDQHLKSVNPFDKKFTK